MSDRSDPLELLQLIRLKLLGTPAITDLVGERIHTSHFMDFDNVTRPLPCIVLELVGGEMAYNQRFQQTTIYIYTYSNQNSAQTLQVYHQCTLALHAERLSHDSLTLKGMLEEISRPTSGYNDKVRSWYARGTFLALMVG